MIKIEKALKGKVIDSISKIDSDGKEIVISCYDFNNSEDSLSAGCEIININFVDGTRLECWSSEWGGIDFKEK